MLTSLADSSTDPIDSPTPGNIGHCTVGGFTSNQHTQEWIKTYAQTKH